MNDFDAIVVGAGPAGVSAALTLARTNLSVALIERGPYPGSKNLMGGVLYTDVLSTILPDFKERGAPLERYLSKKGLSLLSEEGEMAFGFSTAKWDAPPHNHSFTVLRARFDRWYAEQAAAQGVELITGVVVDNTLKDDKGRVVGVATRVPEGSAATEGELRAPVVICAEGANSLLAEREGLKPALKPPHAAIAVKELLRLPEGLLEERFGLEGDRGAAREYVGDATAGLPGAGFLYTNRDTLSVGVVVYLDELADAGLTPDALLDRFKAHPAVRPLVKGGELLEYGAHLIPETGYDGLPVLAKDGFLLVGDAAGLVSTSPRHEGSNYAMASGVMAAEAAIEAHQAGNFTVAGLGGYRKRLEASFVLKNMERYRDWPGFLRRNPHVFASWPGAFASLAEASLKVGEAKMPLESELWDLFQRRVGLLPFAMTAVQLRSALKLLGYGKTDKVLEYIARNW